MIIDKLYDAAHKKSPVCVGLDPQYSYLPQYLKDKDWSVGEKIFEYNKKIVDASIEDAGCYKLQIACYEALGLEGLECFAKSLKYIREKGAIAISDIKRGDISSTAKQYAIGHFTGDFETDFITVNAYMGEDAVSPYYEFLEKDKGMFILIKTSNPSSGEIQDLKLGESTVYQEMGKLVSSWGEAFVGNCGFSSIGAVVGLTYPKEFEVVKQIMPKTFFLIPGYGAQGGTGKDIAEIFKDDICGVVNSSRGIITAHKNKTEGEDFDVCVNQAVKDMKEDILSWL
ncbi:MAG: orotidine-5'-phosphate decarboxylase [Firmicutes bacterium]|nr:orotidine-5'-phosphate decarboxylase [Clostridiales bacterium]MBQ9932046.1 orotidine-5'-phosphate decarboxylase [Bacillota bacterium]